MAISFAAIRTFWSGDTDGTEPTDEHSSSAARKRAPELDATRSDRQAAAAEPARNGRTYAREAGALLLIAVGLYLLLALASYEGDLLRPEVVGPNWVGPVGEVAARGLVHLVGVIAWLVPLEIMLLSRPLLSDTRLELRVTRASGDVLVVVVLAAMAHIAAPAATSFGAMSVSGFVGELFGSVMRGLFSTVGSFLIGGTVVALVLVERATFSFIEAMQALRSRADGWASATRGGAEKVATAWARARATARELEESERRANEPHIITTPEQADAILAAYADSDDTAAGPIMTPVAERRAPGATQLRRPGDARANEGAQGEIATPSPIPPVDRAAETPSPKASKRAKGRGEPCATPSEGTAATPADSGAPTRIDGGAQTPADSDAPTPVDGSFGLVALEATTPGASSADASLARGRAKKAAAESHADVASLADEAVGAADTKPVARNKSAGPVIMDTSGATKLERARRIVTQSSDPKYRFPSSDMLDPAVAEVGAQSKEQLQETARKLERVLADYKVSGTVQEIWPGPTVTMFEVAPAPGTKVSKVAGLAADLALGLSCPVRIIAPLPGKNRIGFEMPNEKRQAVNLRQLIESREFAEMKAPLPCVLGRDGIGRPVFADLAEMPHTIVAGATGQGKSVGLNVILTSLLFRKTPDELRLLMVDPKVVELAPFDRIPHLLLPVVTDMKQATNALKWAVDEMERRYQLFVAPGVRNIGGYNQWVRDVRSGKLPPPPSPRTVEAVAPDGTAVEVEAAKDGSDRELPTTLPYIVIVVDEFADLMLQQGKEVEAPVARLAAKARAAGMHVILATQRPSVDVITGVIKSNFPTRIAFRVAQTVDSRTILDQQGAESLLGKGDMLVKMNGAIDLRRVQGPFISDDEVRRVIEHVRAQGEPVYDESIVRSRDEDGEDGEGGDPGDAERDPMYDLAVKVVAETQKCTVSWIQRKLGIGYNRSAKIVETMEKRGVVGPGVGTKPREVLIGTV